VGLEINYISVAVGGKVKKVEALVLMEIHIYKIHSLYNAFSKRFALRGNVKIFCRRLPQKFRTIMKILVKQARMYM